MSFHVFQTELHRQVQAQGVVLEIGLVQVEADVGRSQFQRAVDVVVLGDFTVKIKVHSLQCQLDGFHIQRQIIGIQGQICIDVLVLHLTFQVQVKAC